MHHAQYQANYPFVAPGKSKSYAKIHNVDQHSNHSKQAPEVSVVRHKQGQKKARKPE